MKIVLTNAELEVAPFSEGADEKATGILLDSEATLEGQFHYI